MNNHATCHGFLQTEAFAELPTCVPLQHVHPPESILPNRTFISFGKIIVCVFYFWSVIWNCQAHLLNSKVLEGKGSIFSISVSAPSTGAWLPAESRESVRGKASDGSNEHQAASQGEMNESWLPFWKLRNVGTELGAGARSPQWRLSLATFELHHIWQMISLLRASVSLTAEQSGYLFLSLEHMFKVSAIVKVEKDGDGKKLRCDMGKHAGDCGSFLRSRWFSTGYSAQIAEITPRTAEP